MSVTLTVNNIPFEYPTPGQEPGWGQPATDWAIEVTEVLNEVLGPNDISETSFAIQNNIAVDTNVANLAFNTGQVRSALINYSIYRTSTANPSGKVETGDIRMIYDNSAAPGSKWLFAVQNKVGVSGVSFSVTDLGQVQYQSTDIGTPGYSGVMHFRAKVLAQ